MSFAIIGAGLGGMATAYHLMTSSRKPIKITLYEGAASLGAGASGAAAGLLHPYNSRGRLLWRGREALDEATQLVCAAEKAVAEGHETFVSRKKLMRPALHEKHRRDLLKQEATPEEGIQFLTHEQVVALVPGLCLPSNCGGIMLDGLVINVEAYLNALWSSVVKAAEERSDGSHANLILGGGMISSLKEIDPSADYAGIVVATGAAAGTIEEVRESIVPGMLTFSQGYSLTLEPQDQSKEKQGPRDQVALYPATSPCILGQTYFSVQGDRIIIGATQSKEGWTPEDGLAMCLAPNGRIIGREDDEDRCVKELMEQAGKIWPPISKGYAVKRVRSGMRALPPKRRECQDFRVPIVRRIGTKERNIWYAGGLGARGFLYHGLVGRAAAGLALGLDETMIPEELR